MPINPLVVEEQPGVVCLDCKTAYFQLDLTISEHAYLVGLAQTDGHLYRGRGNKGAFSIELKARDVKVLEALQVLIPFYSSIRPRRRDTNFALDYEAVTWQV